MTVITVFTRKGSVIGFNASGHSGYADRDSDIVCAGISALTQAACMGITELVKADVSLKVKGGALRIMLKDSVSNEKKHEAELILGTMLLGLRSIEESYSDYLKLSEREV